VGLHLVSKLRYNSALYCPYDGPYAGRGPRRKYGEKLDCRNIASEHLKATSIEKDIATRIYQMSLWHTRFADLLNIVVIVKTNLTTHKTAHVVLLSSDTTLGYEQLIDYYRLRFQLLYPRHVPVLSRLLWYISHDIAGGNGFRSIGSTSSHRIPTVSAVSMVCYMRSLPAVLRPQPGRRLPKHLACTRHLLACAVNMLYNASLTVWAHKQGRAMMTYVYAGAADWGGKDPAKCNWGLYRLSTDTGTCTSLERGLPEQVEVRCLTMHPTQPGVVFAGTQAGPYRSTDAGTTWERMNFPGDEPVVWSFEIHPADARVMYAGTQDMAVYRSDDSGEHWRRLTVPTNPDGLCVMGFPTRMIRLAIDPTNPDELYAGVEVGGLVRSLDGGITWTDCNAPLLALAAQERYTQKHGPRRASEGMMDTHALAISAAQPGTVFLANRLGLFRSDDRGESWDDMDIGRFSPLTYARDVKVFPHDAHTLFGAFSIAAVSDAGSLYRSPDLGATWTRFDHDVSINSTLMIIAASVQTPNRVYCAARRGQVFGTEDGGRSWQTYPLPAEGVYALSCM
jgi:photosystem II stability/assembly factor-like uncharacterized protein